MDEDGRSERPPQHVVRVKKRPSDRLPFGSVISHLA